MPGGTRDWGKKGVNGRLVPEPVLALKPPTYHYGNQVKLKTKRSRSICQEKTTAKGHIKKKKRNQKGQHRLRKKKNIPAVPMRIRAAAFHPRNSSGAVKDRKKKPAPAWVFILGSPLNQRRRKEPQNRTGRSPGKKGETTFNTTRARWGN